MDGAYLLVEDGLGLTTVSRLLAVVTALTLRKERRLARLVLCHLMRSEVGCLRGVQISGKMDIRVLAAGLAVADWALS